MESYRKRIEDRYSAFSLHIVNLLRHWEPACLLVAIGLGASHSYYFLTINLSGFDATTRNLSIARDPAWLDLLQTTTSTASIMALIGGTAGAIGLWFVKVCILRILSLLF